MFLTEGYLLTNQPPPVVIIPDTLKESMKTASPNKPNPFSKKAKGTDIHNVICSQVNHIIHN